MAKCNKIKEDWLAYIDLLNSETPSKAGKASEINTAKKRTAFQSRSQQSKKPSLPLSAARGNRRIGKCQWRRSLHLIAPVRSL